MKVYEKAGVVVRRAGEDGEDEFLAVSARRHPGSWVFPAGTVEKGELPRQAAERECEEESGYTVKTGREICSVSVSEADWTKNFIFFSATVAGRVERKEKDRSVRWVRESVLESEIAGIFLPVVRRMRD